MKILNKKFPGSYVCLNNAMTQLQEDDIIEDVYEEEDVLTAVQKKQDAERLKNEKWVENKSGDIVKNMLSYFWKKWAMDQDIRMALDVCC